MAPAKAADTKPKRLRATLARARAAPDDLFWVAGAALTATGAALERLSAGFIVAGVLLLVVAVGGTRQ